MTDSFPEADFDWVSFNSFRHEEITKEQFKACQPIREQIIKKKIQKIISEINLLKHERYTEISFTLPKELDGHVSIEEYIKMILKYFAEKSPLTKVRVTFSFETCGCSAKD